MPKPSEFFYNFILVIISAFVVAVVGALLLAQVFLPEERSFSDVSLENYNAGWERVYKDGTTEELQLPCFVEVPSGEKLVVQKTLEVWPDRDGFIDFYSAKQDIEVFVDDALRYEYSTADTRAFGSFSPDINLFIPVHPGDQGKTIRVELTGDNNYTGILQNVYLGTQMGIMNRIFAEEHVQISLSYILIFLGVIAATMGFFMRHVYKISASIGFLGWGTLMAGLWVINESQFRQFMVPNFSFSSNITFICIMAMPPLFALYFDSLQQGRYRPVYLMICIFSIVEATLAIVLQFSNGAELIYSLRYSFFLFFADAVVYFITVIPDIINKKVKEYRLEFIGICGGVICCIGQIIAYCTNPTRMNGNMLGIGLLFLLVMACLRAFIDILDLEREKSAAVQASEASSELLARMSHEMRTPINAILGMNMMILRESKEREILEYAKDVNEAGNHLLGIVNEVLDLAKVNSGKMEIQEGEYDLMSVVQECYSYISPRTKNSRLAFVVEMDDILPSVLSGDRLRIIQIIENLLTNAVKYTTSGRIILYVGGKVVDGRLMLKVSVTDTGIGISEECMPYLFDSFKKVGNYKSSKIEGTGLGLGITKQLVELMDGTITVESTYGKGSTFTVIIPQGIRSMEPCGSFSINPNTDRNAYIRNDISKLSGRILVVDDVAINLRVISMLLKDSKLKIETARSGQETLSKITSTKYDIILLDHLMPGMSGIETKQIMDGLDTNLNKDTPIIMQTANAIYGAKEDYLGKGFSDYITKPIKEDELIAMLKKYLVKEETE